MTLAFMSVSVLLLALCVRTTSYVNKTLCVGRAHFLRAFTHLGILRSNAKFLNGRSIAVVQFLTFVPDNKVSFDPS